MKKEQNFTKCKKMLRKLRGLNVFILETLVYALRDIKWQSDKDLM